MKLPTRTIVTIALAPMTQLAGGLAAAVSANPQCRALYDTCEREQCKLYTDMAIARGSKDNNNALVAGACLAKCKAKGFKCKMSGLKLNFKKPRHKCMALNCR